MDKNEIIEGALICFACIFFIMLGYSLDSGIEVLCMCLGLGVVYLIIVVERLDNEK